MSADDRRADDAAALKRRVSELPKELSRLGPLMRGSLVVIGTRNKQPYFSVNITGGTDSQGLLYRPARSEYSPVERSGPRPSQHASGSAPRGRGCSTAARR